jgi:hypothetical protein
MTATPEVGKPVKRGAGWWVPSGEAGHFVEIRTYKIRCTCLSFVHRRTRLYRGEGKPIQAVHAALKEVMMG